MSAKNRQAILKVLSILLLSGILISALFLYARLLSRELRTDTMTTLKEVSAQSALTVEKEVKSELYLLNEISVSVEIEGTQSLMDAVDGLKEVAERYSFKRMGVILPDGTAYTTDNEWMNLADRDYFIKGMAGTPAVSDLLKDRIGGAGIVVFSWPLFQEDDVAGVLFATYSVEEFRHILSVSSFGGDGYSYIVRKNGDLVVDSDHPASFPDIRNISDSVRRCDGRNQKSAELLAQQLAEGKSGYIQFRNGALKYMYITPLAINDWMLLTIVPATIVNSTLNFVMTATLALCLLLALLFGFLIWIIVRGEKQKKKQLTDFLYVDALTGGYSYARFCVEVQKALTKLSGNAAYLVVDIDHFKLINELYGYEQGNQTIRHIWETLRQCRRPGDYFARSVADRFVAYYTFRDEQDLNFRLREFCKKLREDYGELKDHYILKPAVGVYVIQNPKEDIQSMHNCAVMAHSTIKGRQDADFAFYDESFRKRMLANKQLEDQMERAYQTGEFVAYYQPKYTGEGVLTGAEALIRWKKPDGTLIPPSDFIPLAEKNGFVTKLDQVVFSLVCQKQREWLDKGLSPVPISVNLSRQHLNHPEFVDTYQRILQKSGVPIRYLQLEITESAVFENQAAFSDIINRLHKLGFLILMDDFGTGYSSLTMLRTVSIDILKLDKSFVDDFDSERGRKILESVVRLAQSLQIGLVAEGAETKEQVDFLKELRCDSIQGYYFSRPIPDDDFEKLLAK